MHLIQLILVTRFLCTMLTHCLCNGECSAVCNDKALLSYTRCELPNAGWCPNNMMETSHSKSYHIQGNQRNTNVFANVHASADAGPSVFPGKYPCYILCVVTRSSSEVQLLVCPPSSRRHKRRAQGSCKTHLRSAATWPTSAFQESQFSSAVPLLHPAWLSHCPLCLHEPVRRQQGFAWMPRCAWACPCRGHYAALTVAGGVWSVLGAGCWSSRSWG